MYMPDEGQLELAMVVNNGSVAELHLCQGPMRASLDAFEYGVQWIALYVVPVMSLVGIVNNMIVCAVMLQRSTDIHRKGKIMYCAMALADLLQILVNSIGRVFVIYGLRVDLSSMTNTTCKVYSFMSALSIGLSNGYAALFAIERCMSAYRWSSIRFSHVRLLLALAVTTVVQMLASMPFGYIMDVLEGEHAARRICEMSPSDMADVALLVTELFGTYVPCFVLLGSDFALLMFLLRRRQTLQLVKKIDTKQQPEPEADSEDAEAELTASGELRSDAPSQMHLKSQPQPRTHRVESIQMRTIIGNIKACVVMSTLRCIFLLSCITSIQAYYAVLKFDGGKHPDHCIADMLHALGGLSLGASVVVLASTFFVLLWRVRAFRHGFWSLMRRMSSSSRSLAAGTGSGHSGQIVTS